MIVFIFVVVVSLSMILLSYLFGPKKITQIKSEPFECGMPQADIPKHAIKYNFYLIAVLFLVFDLEIIYLYPWASYLKYFSFYGFLSGVIFISILFLTLIYIFKRGVLKWD